MRRVGIATVSLLLYALAICGTTFLMLGALALSGYFGVWRGLSFPIDLTVSAKLLGLGLAVLAVECSLMRLCNRALSR